MMHGQIKIKLNVAVSIPDGVGIFDIILWSVCPVILGVNSQADMGDGAIR